MPRAALLLFAALLALPLVHIARPVHYDEANFLVLARGAAEDPWRPHDVHINWQGVDQRAFDVLSNPPGIAWWLAPVHDAPVVVQRLFMLPWLALVLFGAWRLGGRFTGDPVRGALVLLTSPIVLLSTPALLPDAPLYALTLAGVGGFVTATDEDRPAFGWALLAGFAAWFRYSGLALGPLLVVYALVRGRKPVHALAAFLPPLALALHDQFAYGAVHVLAMGSFQAVATTPEDVFHKGVSAIAMLGGAAALPFFPWSRASFAGAAIGACLGAAWGWPGALFAALGGATLGAVPGRGRGWLALWAFGGLAFLLTLRFTATRYWLPFLPGVLLALPTGRWPRVFIGTQLALAFLLAADEDRSARAQALLADQVAALGVGTFTGHWGWQWAMERQGWRALDEGARPPVGTLVAMPRQAWPQPVDVSCARVVWEGAARPPIPWLPRGYSEEAHANLHANWIYDRPPVRTVIPWGFANDPYERVRVCQE